LTNRRPNAVGNSRDHTSLVAVEVERVEERQLLDLGVERVASEDGRRAARMLRRGELSSMLSAPLTRRRNSSG
jgi:hypothetical protein